MIDTNKPLGFENLPVAEVAFAYIDVPQKPLKHGQQPTYKVTLKLTQQEAQVIANQLEAYNQQIDAMFPSTPRNQSFFKPETVSKNDKTLTGNYLLEFRNVFPVKVYDNNNNLIDPPPRITRGSKVQLNIGILPFEFNGTHGISRTRLYAVKIIEMGESAAANPFGKSQGAPTIAPGQGSQVGTPSAMPPPVAPPANPYAPPQVPNVSAQYQPTATNPYAPPQGVASPAVPSMPGMSQPAGLNVPPPDFDDDVPF